MLGRHKNSGLARSIFVLGLLALVTLIVPSGSSSADILKSPDYQLQPTVGDSFGGSVGSASYQLTDSGGEAAIGNGAGGSYKLGSGFVAELQHSINLYVEPAGLTGYWPMNEGTGPTVHDASGNNDDGTTVNSPSWVTGKIGDALSFNGTNQYVAINNFSAGPAINGTQTISAWFFLNSTSSTQDIATIYNGGSAANQLRINSDTLQVSSWGGTNLVNSSKAVSANFWHQAVFTYNGSVADIYLDGNLVGQSTNTPQSGASSKFYIGTYGTGEYFNGDIDEVKVFNRALSQDEVTANYEAGLAGFDSGLVIPPVKAGTSQTADADVIVSADAPYSLLTRETGPLTLATNNSVTIPAISANIASPTAWNEGITKGLGFTVLSGPNGVPAQWASGANYAAIPLNATTFYTRSGFNGGAKDVVQVQYRLDVSGAQPAGQYKNNVVYTATETP